MALKKESKSLGMSWEKEYGYSQAVKVGDTIYVSGQVSHDDEGKIFGRGDMEAQMRQAYANIQKMLEQYGATMDNVIDEVLFVTDMNTASQQRSSVDRRSFLANQLWQVPLCKSNDLHSLIS